MKPEWMNEYEADDWTQDTCEAISWWVDYACAIALCVVAIAVLAWV
jgi:hypothetical protein